MSQPATPAFRADPAQGRVFAAARVVRSTDVTPAGRFRFDALARYLQDAAEDDLADAGWDEPYTWLARRVAVTVRGYPARHERVSLRTFCSATGPRWAERTTTLAGPGGDLIQATAVWVAIAPGDGRPVPLGEGFHRLYGASAQGRHVSARLSHPGPPAWAAGRGWPLRAVDFDVAGHVNNTVHWAAVEEVLAGLDGRPARAELEYHRAVRPGAGTRLLTSQAPGELAVWLCRGTERLASGLLEWAGPDQAGCGGPGMAAR